jgi:oxalate---CoA ligase
MDSEFSASELISTIPDLLAGRARRTPDAAAILAPGRPDLTYGRLWQSICSIRDQLGEMGISRNQRIGIVLPNGPEMAVSFLAVSSCAVSAPLNPAYQASEFHYYLSDLQAGALIVPEGSESPATVVARELKIPTLELTATPDAPAGVFTLSKQRLGPGGSNALSAAGDVALVLHTSGTTSRPKMVPLTQRNLSLSAQNIARWFAIGETDCCLNIMPLFHIHGLIGAVLSSLAAGSCAVCSPGFDSTKFFDWMQHFRPTWYTAVPTMHQAILARAGQHRVETGGSRLRFIRSCSSALAPSLLDALESAFGVPVLESYGMTEASHQIAGNPLPPGVHKPGSVGLAAGPEVAIMDPQGELLPIGKEGEIVLRGATITAGYTANPEANTKTFTNGWFRTGDQGYLDDDDYIFISARIKEIINRAGEKISPREIEEALLQHPAVSQAVAFSVPHRQLGEDVGAAVVLKPGAAASESELRRYAEQSLAHFKVPRIIRMLSEIPKGPTGKIQRIGLSERLGLQPLDDAAVAAYREAETPLQRELVRIFSEILAVKKLGVDDSFFAAGGDSILATALMVRLMRETGVRLSLVDFMENPSAAGVAERIEAGKHDGSAIDGSSLLVPVQPQGTNPPIFCFPGLHGELIGFWNLSRHLGPVQPLYAFALGGGARSRRPLSINELAASCIDNLKASGATAPYYLLGNCFGGFVAYEMARQLSNSGEKVALLIMLDCFNHDWRRGLPITSRLAQRLEHARTRVRFQLRTLAGLGNSQRFSYLRSRSKAFAEEARNRWVQALFNMCVHRNWAVPGIASNPRYANRWAEISYQRQPYAGEIAMFRTTDPLAGVYSVPLMGWGDLLQGSVKCCDIPGHHLEMLAEPAVGLLARYLKERLQQATQPPVLALGSQFLAQ